MFGEQVTVLSEMLPQDEFSIVLTNVIIPSLFDSFELLGSSFRTLYNTLSLSSFLPFEPDFDRVNGSIFAIQEVHSKNLAQFGLDSATVFSTDSLLRLPDHLPQLNARTLSLLLQAPHTMAPAPLWSLALPEKSSQKQTQQDNGCRTLHLNQMHHPGSAYFGTADQPIQFKFKTPSLSPPEMGEETSDSSKCKTNSRCESPPTPIAKDVGPAAKDVGPASKQTPGTW
jgi:hypothetical protein